MGWNAEHQGPSPSARLGGGGGWVREFPNVRNGEDLGRKGGCSPPPALGTKTPSSAWIAKTTSRNLNFDLRLCDPNWDSSFGPGLVFSLLISLPSGSLVLLLVVVLLSILSGSIFWSKVWPDPSKQEISLNLGASSLQDVWGSVLSRKKNPYFLNHFQLVFLVFCFFKDCFQ